MFSYVSLNGYGYGFDQDFGILSFGDSSDGNDCGYWGCGTSFKKVVDLGGGKFEYQLLGTGEPHGTIRFLGAFSTLTWRSLSNEYWNGFTVGVQGTAAEVSDADGDGVDDADDNCPNDANPNQIDTDNDGIGAACDNEPPLLTIFGPATYTEADAPVIVDPSLTLTASDDIDGAKVSIGAGFVAAQDKLGIDGTLPTGLGSSYNSTAGVLTITGTKSASIYQTALRQVTYENTSGAPDLTARKITFSIGSGLAFPDNGHFYEFVPVINLNWNTASGDAGAKSLFGLQGYLATITSAEENAFVFDKLQGNGWLGGNDATTEGTWKWITGPEAGTVFCIGTGTCAPEDDEYSNWNSGEPNNCCGSEDYLHMIGNPKLGAAVSFWNDLGVNGAGGAYTVLGYVVKYGGTASDPSLQLSGTVTVNVAACQDGAAGGDLVSYWRGEGNACDSADSNHGARVGGTTFAASKVGQGFSFDGVNDYVTVPDDTSLRLGKNQTIKAWYKWQGGGNNDWRRLVGKGAASPRNYGLWIYPQANLVLFQIYNQGATVGCNAILSVASDSNWHQLAGTYDGSRIKLYYDDGLVSDVACTLTPAITADPLTIGYANAGVTPFHSPFDGFIDEVKIYNTAHTAQEIAAQYNKTNNGPISLWPAEGNANDIVDGNDGTLTNGATATAPGVFGTAFNFDGVNDHVVVPDSLNLNPANGITLEAWVYLTGKQGQNRDIISKDGELSQRQFLLTASNVNRFRAHVGTSSTTSGPTCVTIPYGSSGLHVFDGATPVDLDEWYHVAMTYDGSTLNLYVNGVLDGSCSVTGTIITTSQPVRIGGGAPLEMRRCISMASSTRPRSSTAPSPPAR